MPWFFVSVLAVIAVFAAIGSRASCKVASASDYAVAGHRAGPTAIAGVIMGALVAGGSTVGTVQLAYDVGLSAWWFTLGSGIACAILGAFFARRARSSEMSTLTEIMERSYGKPVASLTMLSAMLGTLLSVVTQFMAGCALLMTILPISRVVATLLLSLLILAFIFGGGLKSYGAVGTAKTALLYALLAAGCIRCMTMGQGIGEIVSSFSFDPWLNIFGSGVGNGLGACGSLVTGVLCTQIYMQAVFSARSERDAVRGCTIAAIAIPPVGLMCIWIGLAMRNAGVEIDPVQALPYFLNEYFHPAIGGIFWAGLAVTVIGGASGLCLGVATNIAIDIAPRVLKIEKNDRRVLVISRCAVLATVASCAAVSLAAAGAHILNVSYIAVGLRGAGMVIPLIAALVRPGLISKRGALASSSAGIVVMLAAWAFTDAEPMFCGLTASASAAAVSILLDRRK